MEKMTAASGSSMKTCPVCGASCFGDMETCFSCLHAFNACVSQGSVGFAPGSCDGGGMALPEVPFVPEEAVAPAEPAFRACAGADIPLADAVIPSTGVDAFRTGGAPAQVRIVIDVQGLAAVFSQKS